jgi:hypothetical protein
VEKPAGPILVRSHMSDYAIIDSYDAAKRVVERGDTLMHNHIYEPKVLKQMAVDSITDLTQVIVEIMDTA